MVSFTEGTDLSLTFSDVTLVDTVRSPRAKIDLWRHPSVGRILVIDGEIQHVEKWQSLYHEPLVHLPAAFVPEVKRVLILGGGSLFAAAQALLYPTVTTVTLVDHDREVLELVARHYKHARSVCSDTRFNFIHSDAVDYLEGVHEQFDLVINDGFDLVSPPKVASIHQLMSKQLSPIGACADVTYRHLFDTAHLANTLEALSQNGPHIFSLVVVPEYPGILHLLTVWGCRSISQDLVTPLNPVQQRWCATTSPPDMQYFRPGHLGYYLYLPPYIRRHLNKLSDEDALKPKIS